MAAGHPVLCLCIRRLGLVMHRAGLCEGGNERGCSGAPHEHSLPALRGKSHNSGLQYAIGVNHVSCWKTAPGQAGFCSKYG